VEQERSRSLKNVILLISEVEHVTCPMQCSVNHFLLCTEFFKISMFEPDMKSIELKHTRWLCYSMD